MDQEKIGKFISELRKEKNLTQQDLADKLGVSNKTVGNWENGRNMPDLSLFRPLCNELDIKADELLLGERIGNDTKKKEEVKTIIKELVNDKSNKKRNIKEILLDLFTEEVLENDESIQLEENRKTFSILSLIIINLISILSVIFMKLGKNSWLKFCPWLIGLISILYIITITDKDKTVDRISKIICYIIVVLITVFFIKLF